MSNCCVTLKGITRGCDTFMGGIEKVFIACFDDVTDVTVEEEVITAIESSESAFKEFSFRKQTGSVTTNITKDEATGSTFYESDIVLQFAKQETAKRVEIGALAVGDLVVIVKDNNGTYWYFGKDFPVSLKEGAGETGTAFGDFNGYNLTLGDFAKELPYEVEKEAIKGLNTKA